PDLAGLDDVGVRRDLDADRLGHHQSRPAPWSRKARPSSRSSAVSTSSRLMPSCTMANATSGWMPTITVVAPRSRVMWARVRSDRAANESMRSSAVTSTMMPRDRNLPTWPISSSCSCSASESVMADWIDAIRTSPCWRIGTGTADPRSANLDDRFGGARDLVAEQPLRLLDPALE